MEEKRRFNRMQSEVKVLVAFEDCIVEAELVNTCLNGALVAFENIVKLQIGDILDIALKLGNSDVVLQFESKVMHRTNNVAGVKFNRPRIVASNSM